MFKINRPGRKPRSPLTVYNMKGRPKLKKQLLSYLDFCENTRRFRPETMTDKVHCMNEFVREIRINSLEELSNKAINDWINRMTRRGLSPVSVNHLLAQVKVMLKWQRDMQVIMKDLQIGMIVLQKVPASDKIMSYRRDDIVRALAFADRREWLMISLFFDCGLRISELQHLRVQNIHGRELRIIGKGGKLRFAMMSAETSVRLDDYIKRENINDWIFVGRFGDKPLSTNQIRRCTKAVFEAAGFTDYHPHKLRHSFAMDLLDARGLSVRQIQKLLGHAKTDTTEQYLDQLTVDQQRELWEKARFGDDYTLDYYQKMKK